MPLETLSPDSTTCLDPCPPWAQCRKCAPDEAAEMALKWCLAEDRELIALELQVSRAALVARTVALVSDLGGNEFRDALIRALEDLELNW